MTSVQHGLVQALLDPARWTTYSEDQWSGLIAAARAANLLGKLCAVGEAAGQIGDLPVPVQRRLRAAKAVSDRQREMLSYELQEIRAALGAGDIPWVVLKGAAYALGKPGVAAGRIASDIDILVPLGRLAEVERRLMMRGWISSVKDAYDQAYYRRWMHELPPLAHVKRGSSLDVHHALSAPTSRIPCPGAPTLEAAVPAPGFDGIRMPCDTDLILHSATHLYLESEWHHGLRDVFDLHQLLLEKVGEAGFARQLVARAEVLGLVSPLRFALRCCRRLFDTPLEPVLEPLADGGGGMLGWRDGMFLSALRPRDPNVPLPFGGRLAHGALYLRGHWLRMPARLLVPHLLRKGLRTLRPEREQMP